MQSTAVKLITGEPKYVLSSVKITKLFYLFQDPVKDYAGKNEVITNCVLRFVIASVRFCD